MIEALRQDVKNLIESPKPDNPSLCFQRLVPHIPDPTNSSDRKSGREKLVEALTHRSLPIVYKCAFQRWKNYLNQLPDCTVLEFTTISRLLIGFGESGVAEFGCSLLCPWGAPFLPGSSLKGVTAHFACEVSPGWALPEKAGKPSGGYALDAFGGWDNSGQAWAGGLDFLDAWCSPDSDKVFVHDIITPHDNQYYRGEGPPDGTSDPVPVKIVAIKSGVKFLGGLRGPKEWRKTVVQLMQARLKLQGIGAKTRVGYGRMLVKPLPTTSQCQGTNADAQHLHPDD